MRPAIRTPSDDFLAAVDRHAAAGRHADLRGQGQRAIAETRILRGSDCGLRRSISRYFFGIEAHHHDALHAIAVGAHVGDILRDVDIHARRSRDITAISVVVARIIPSRVRKLRSLLPRSEWRAPFTASQNDACDVIQT